MVSVEELLLENRRRSDAANAKFNPITGEGSIGERTVIEIPDFPIRKQWLPKSMLRTPLVRKIVKAGSIRAFLESIEGEVSDMEEARQSVIDQFTRLRCLHDFPFWAALHVYIKKKGGGEDVLFRLNRPQRKLIAKYEQKRLAGKPIRLVLLKARQWGGSTATQIYMAWLQLVHKTGLNSLIISHVKDTSVEILDMFKRMINRYPTRMLYSLGEAYSENENKWAGVGNTGNIHLIPQRNCKIKIGTAEKPDSCRGGDYNLVHLSEVGVWKKTEGKEPADIVRSACSGILLVPYTMIVYESTANGTGNFFQQEYDDAKSGKSQFDALFISWYEIENNSIPFQSDEERRNFAAWLLDNRENRSVASEREEPGIYLWYLWELGATLEAIHWYVEERKKYREHGKMASECPSDDVEAFVHSGERVFDQYKINDMKRCCRPPKFIGDIYADGDEGEEALQNLRFSEDRQGVLKIWDLPEITPNEVVTDRYLAVVDVGGRSDKADYSVIVVFDRLGMIDCDKPCVVAQWHGHIDMDLLAWKAAQVAAYYDNALLVIESNTLETHDKERQVDGDQSHYILNVIREVYPNLYARRQSEDAVRQGLPKTYGFHTNISTKPAVISTLVKSIRDNLYVERDEDCIAEYLTYERKPNGSYGAILGMHDDLLMTRAIGLHICFHEMPLPQIVSTEQKTINKPAVSAATI